MSKTAVSSNPLLDFSGLPRFPEVLPAHVTPAVDELLQHNRDVVARLLADSAAPTWDNFVLPLDDANEKMSRAWGQVSHLNAVMNSAELREVYNTNLPKITQYYAELGQNLALFAKFKALRASGEFDALNLARKKIIENELRDFRLSGAELAEDKKARFLEIQEEMSTLCSRFSDNILDATNDFTLLVEDSAELGGIPADDLQAAEEAAQAAGKKGWLFTLKAPSYMPVLQYADNRALREKLYVAYSQRASEFGKAEWDNAPLITQILKLRAEEALLLGYASYAELSLASKMANTPEQILKFLRELAQHARPLAEKDLSELREFASANLALHDLQSWDIGYASEKLRQQRYAFSEQDVKQYFPEDAVIAGMFHVVQKIYGLSLRPSSAPVWHEAVRFFDVCDADGTLIGQFYMDLYARNSKRGGAWMDDAITRRRLTPGLHEQFAIQTPVAYLNCNFAPPVGGKAALFTHDEVLTLFHEFGHGLHHLLTEVEDMGVSGISGVEWDAVELPSQFMENFCWEWEVLSSMTRHIDSGDKLPRALFDKMLAAKNFQIGMQTLRQIEFSIFDMRLHSDYDAQGNKSVLALLDEVRREVAVLIPPPYNRFPNSFSHIFSGGYAAGYYSYKWAEVLSADAYSLFEEHGVLNAEIGALFRKEVLAMGGSRDAMASFVAFRGREPSIEALLRHNGLLKS
ncbi:MAG: oligopeptidase A [Gallionellales bacterium 35-53-114]|jgi:oligopeptidase A|nr:MAG: oligopeptidase A [Gallionellales bacterium 35-53-114]OYZ63498.1 MAG: oligopeptidase A [Gallionellales bacterium 24-53-125]OZB10890.1 MAG: oligopeptidase A [Gallionellales bacterium 39-52-133]HQS58930.1 M3 family metallopeptidase [Gallionellaceae bacterium]HQS75685.1 M3 family metallopeptidase [Gallionellaceae bacterium]